jgi:hypothetical protein
MSCKSNFVKIPEEDLVIQINMHVNKIKMSQLLEDVFEKICHLDLCIIFISFGLLKKFLTVDFGIGRRRRKYFR